jgi:hypothetical protein
MSDDKIHKKLDDILYQVKRMADASNARDPVDTFSGGSPPPPPPPRPPRGG